MKVRTIGGERVHFVCFRENGTPVAIGLERWIVTQGRRSWKTLASMLADMISTWELIIAKHPGGAEGWAQLGPAPAEYWRAAGLTPPSSS